MLYLLYPDINLCFNAIFLSRFFADIKNYTTFATLLKGSTSAKEFWRGRSFGEVAEWSIAAVLKTVVLRGTRGSNPCLSAEYFEY